MPVSPLAGKPAPASILINIPKLIAAYYSEKPDYAIVSQRISFGTSGHRGSSFDRSFNEAHILALSQAICLYRKQQNITGPLFLGMDTHALSFPAYSTAVEVFAANGIELQLAENDEFTPTPVISHAIINYNRGRSDGFSDGIVVTPSHNPPADCGFKYNPPNGGPADTHVTSWIQNKANEFLQNSLAGVERITYEKAIQLPSTHRFNYINNYVSDLSNVIDMNIIRDSKINLGVDPLGGAGVHYWKAIVERYNINLTILNETIDPTFSFMTVDWDGKIRMDPSSTYAMQRLIHLKDKFEVAFACDTDYDRHGIITKSEGLLPPNHYLTVAISYLFKNRPQWSKSVGVGKTIVTTQMINRLMHKLERTVYEVPVGFKWFVDGLTNNTLSFCGEESAGATFARMDGQVWTTDKDGIILALLAAEMTAKMNIDPGDLYRDLMPDYGNPYYDRIDAPATPEQKAKLKKLSADQISFTHLAGDKIQEIQTKAPGNGAPIDGIKVITDNSWFAARPSGTENIYKIYAETFGGQEHLAQILEQAQEIVDKALAN